MGRSRAKGTSGGKAPASAAEVGGSASVAEAVGSLKRMAAGASKAGGSLKRKAAGASKAGGSLERKAASASEGGGSLERKAASASVAGDSGLEGKQVSTAEERRTLKLKKEEDRKILRLKKEEDRLKLKKEYMAAEAEAFAKLPASYRVSYRPASPVKVPATGKNTSPVKVPATGKKKVLLVKRLVPQEQIDALLALPKSILPDELTAKELAKYSKSFQDMHNQEVNIANKLREYHQALVDQYFKFGYAVDESEAEVTDDEAEEDNN